MNRTPALIALLALVVVAVVGGSWIARNGPAEPGQPLTRELSPPPDPMPEAAGDPAEDSARESGEPEPALDTDRQALLDPESAIVLTGRVILPGACADESLEVFCLSRARTYRGFARREALARFDEEERSSWEEELLAVAPVLADGSFSLVLPAELPEGCEEGNLMLRGRFHYLARTEAVPLAEISEGTPAELVLEPIAGAWITGRLDPPEGDRPDFAAIRMRLRAVDMQRGNDESAFLRMRFGCDEDGRFEIRAAPVGIEYDLGFEPDDHAPLKMSVSGLQPCTERSLVVPLRRGSRVRGHVVDASGAPLPGADVEALLRGRFFGFDDRVVREGRADAEGAFDLQHLPVGRFTLRAQHLGYVDGKKHALDLADEGLEEGVLLELGRGAAIAGTVSWPDGAPAADVRVRVGFDPTGMVGAGAFSALRGAKSHGRTDAQGRFRVTGLGSGPFVVSCDGVPPTDDPGSAGETQHWARRDGVRPGAELDLVLRAPLSIVGRVVDDRDQPIQASFKVQARLVLEGASPILDQIGEDTDFDDEDNVFGFMGGHRKSGQFESEDGSFTLTDVAEGSWRLEASCDGWVTLEPVEVELSAGGASEPLVIRLAPTAVANGVVLSPEGEPVAGAQVTVDAGSVLAQLSTSNPETESDAEGRFRLEGLTPGTLALFADAKDHARSASVMVTIAPGAEAEDVELVLAYGGTLTGEVYDAAGDPAVGRMVAVNNLQSMRNRAVQTDARGEFQIEHLEPGTWQVIAMDTGADWAGDGEGFDMGSMVDSMKMSQAEITEGETTHVVIGAPPADPVRVHGTVTHAGQPYGGATLSFYPEGERLYERLVMGQVAEDGTYELTLDGSGGYVANVQRLGLQPGQQRTIEYFCDIPEGESEHRLDFDLPLGRISGQLRGPDGAPAADARVSLTLEGGTRSDSFFGGQLTEIQADGEGRFDIEALDPGTYRLSAGGPPMFDLGVESPRYGRVTRGDLDLDEGQWLRDVDLRLPVPGTLEVTVRGTDGTPVPNATIFVRDASGRMLEALSLRSTDATGRCRYPGLAPGRFTLVARAGTQCSVESAPVDVGEGDTRSVELSMQEGVVLWVRLKDAGSGEPVRARVRVFDDQGREVSGMFGMQDLQVLYFHGAWSPTEHRLGPMPPGKYRVHAETDDGRRSVKPVILKAGGGERKVTLRLKG